MNCFVKEVINNGGSIHSLLFPSDELNGFPAITNPSIYLDGDRLLVNLRNINYTLYHSEKKIYEHQWGPLVYIHPENDLHLRTRNIVGELNEDMQLIWHTPMDTSTFDTYEPMWDFVGLEDARIVRWDNKLYFIGVRRDTTTDGQGRMELSEVVIDEEHNVKEISRSRIPSPNGDGSYCEKNWVPILDMPYHMVKWSNGTEVVKVDPEKKTCETVILKDWKDLGCADLRGGSQVLSYKGYYISLTHTTYLFQSPAGRKDGTYRHRFVVWDKDWNIVRISDEFAFLGAEVEFAVGMCQYKNDFLITFGFQDNAAYLLRVPGLYFDSFVLPK